MGMTRPILDRSPGIATSFVLTSISLASVVFRSIGHRLYWRACAAIGRLIRGRGYYCVLALAGDCRFKVSLDDPYWSRLVGASFEYEPDFLDLLTAIRDLDYTFLDCGANFGFWSIRVSGRDLGAKPTVAIEAFEPTFARLRENCSLNGDRFRTLSYALWNRDGDRVVLENTHHHAGIRVGTTSSGGAGPQAGSITLDGLVDGVLSLAPGKLVIKLDVEGAEAAVMEGASAVLRRDVLFYYEDHGRDRKCEATRMALEALGLRVFFFIGKGRWTPVYDIGEARALKRRKTVGYNFAACRPESGFLSLLEGLCRT